MNEACEALKRGLSSLPKTIPSYFCYDDLGSQFFEQRCQSPEYYLTRTENRLITLHAREIAETVGDAVIVELGCGNGEKIPQLVDGFRAAGAACSYFGVDINGLILRTLRERLERECVDLKVETYLGDFSKGLKHVPPDQGEPLFTFLGSTIGNMSDDDIRDFLSSIAESTSGSAYLLLGADFVKAADTLEQAYDDSDGAGRRMELNTLANINKSLSANFDTSKFDYATEYDGAIRTVRAKLVSRCAQQVDIRDLNFRFSLDAGDFIQVGQMRKFDAAQIEALIKPVGFAVSRQWEDSNFPYGLFLLKYGGV